MPIPQVQVNDLHGRNVVIGCMPMQAQHPQAASPFLDRVRDKAAIVCLIAAQASAESCAHVDCGSFFGQKEEGREERAAHRERGGPSQL